MHTVFITGANRGLGYEIAKGLITRCDNWHVLIGCRDAASGQQVVDELERLASQRPVATRCRVALVSIDVCDQRSIAQACEQIRFLSNTDRPAGETGCLDALVNNAGILYRTSDLPPAEQAKNTIECNFFAQLHVIDAMLPLMKPNGRIVNMSSRMGLIDGYPIWNVAGVSSATLKQDLLNPNLTLSRLEKLASEYVTLAADGKQVQRGWPNTDHRDYNVSKMLFCAATRVLARDPRLLAMNITIVSMCPGWCRTDMGTADAPKSAEEGADTAIWLLSEEVKPMTGCFYGERQKISYLDGHPMEA